MLLIRTHWLALTLLLAILSLPVQVRGQVPPRAGAVTDSAAVLSAQERVALEGLLEVYERETSHQIAVLTVPSLAGETIESLSLRVAKGWGLGRRGVDNGILVVLAPQDKKVRIELGRGFERWISNDRAREIVRLMTASFRRGDFAHGPENGVRQLMQDGRAFVVTASVRQGSAEPRPVPAPAGDMPPRRGQQ